MTRTVAPPILFLILGTIGAARIAQACDCITVQASGLAGYKAARFVYVGRVEGNDGDRIRPVRPIRIYKGARRTYTLASDSACGYLPKPGTIVLVYATEDPQPIGNCGNQPIDICRAKDDIAVLDRYLHLPPLGIADCPGPPREKDAN